MNRVYKSAGKLRQLRGTQAGVNRFRASLFVVGYAIVVGGGWILATYNRVQVREIPKPQGNFLTSELWNLEVKPEPMRDTKNI